MTLPIYFHEDVVSFKTPDGLFERPASPLLKHQVMFTEGPERIENIKSVLERAPSADCFSWHQGRHVSDQEILRFHTTRYLNNLKTWDKTGEWVTGTTFLPKDGLKGVRAGAGTTLKALEAILKGETQKAYALVRPPSHHAAPDVVDGYCLLNNVGIAVHEAKAQGVKRIAILDWDVHHGNGTQTGFYQDNNVLTISMHMDHGAWGASHPETGDVNEIGEGNGEGTNLNLPLPMGSGDQTYLETIKQIVVPALTQFKPELIIVSNGHDASAFDPNGRQLITMAGFHAMAKAISDAAETLCDGKILIVQEGGYNVAYVGFCAYGSAMGFAWKALDLSDPLAYYPDNSERAKLIVSDLIDRHPLL